MRIVIIFLLFFFSSSAYAIFKETAKNDVFEFQTEKKIVYQKGALYLQGFYGPGNIEVYSIIGNKITEKQAYDLTQFSFPLDLASGNMFIIRVLSNGKMDTFKIIS